MSDRPLRTLAWPRSPQALAAADLSAAALAWPLALVLAAPGALPGTGPLLAGALVSGAGFLLAGLLFGLPRQDWRSVGLADAAAIAAAAALGAALTATAEAPIGWSPPNPATPLLHGLLLALLPGGARLALGWPAPRPADARQPVPPREVAIEELLDRPQRIADRGRLARLLGGRVVVVTGAGGTIGGELARQVAEQEPALLVLLDHAEAALYEAELDIAERSPDVPRRAVLADIRDEARIGRLFDAIRPDLVFHAAALKHVPMVERDPCEGVLTNALGTRIVADAAAAAGARAMVLVSTDKAVNPASVMGASKRLAETYAQAMDREARRRGGLRIVTVRFGNVLGSTGSVVPLFRRQLARGVPLTVTHPEMRRYFMTVREAVGLVLDATVAGADPAGEAPPDLAEGGIFVLDMGEPVRILDLARRMMRLSGREVGIRVTGLRPGEKLGEELFHGAEPPRPTRFPGLLMATPRPASPEVARAAMERVATAARSGDAAAALAALAAAVPEYRPGL